MHTAVTCRHRRIRAGTRWRVPLELIWRRQSQAFFVKSSNRHAKLLTGDTVPYARPTCFPCPFSPISGTRHEKDTYYLSSRPPLALFLSLLPEKVPAHAEGDRQRIRGYTVSRHVNELRRHVPVPLALHEQADDLGVGFRLNGQKGCNEK